METPVPETPKTPEQPKPVIDAQAAQIQLEQHRAQREKEINSNLNEGFANSPGLFKDRATFDQAYSYASKPANERGILDAFWKSKTPSTPNEFSQAIASGTPVPASVAKTPAYAEAQKRNAVVDQFKWAD